MVTESEDYRACIEALAALSEYEPDAAVGLLEPLLTKRDCRCLGEAAFLLGVARLAQPEPEETRHRAAAEAFAVAAEQRHSVYSPTAAYRYATLLDSADGEATRAAWRRVANLSLCAYSPVAHFMIGHSLHRDGLDAEQSMMSALTSCDPEYAPRAAIWLLEQDARAGRSDRAQCLAGTINDFKPTFVHRDFHYHQWLVPLWRRQLLNHAYPLDVLRATHALAQFDGVTQSPTLATMLRDHIRAQSNGEEPAEPGLAANPTERPPWWISTVATHRDQGTLDELAHDLFWVINKLYAHPAIAYAEGTVEQADAMVRNIVHTMDEFSWGPLLHEDFRQRVNRVLQEEVLPPGWTDLRRTGVLPPG